MITTMASFGLAANLLFPNTFAMARVLSLWRSIEKKSLNLRLEGRWVGINLRTYQKYSPCRLRTV